MNLDFALANQFVEGGVGVDPAAAGDEDVIGRGVFFVVLVEQDAFFADVRCSGETLPAVVGLNRILPVPIGLCR